MSAVEKAENVATLRQVGGAPRDLSEFAESNHTAFIDFDIFFRPEKRQRQRDRDRRERGQTDLAHRLPQHRAVVRHAFLSLPAQR